MKRVKKLLSILLVLSLIIVFPENVLASESLGNMTPVHSFSFDNDSGTTVVDNVTGSSVNGVATGTTLIAGYDGTGYARHFNGSSYITFNDRVLPAGEKSLSFKIRKEKVTGNTEYFFGNAYNGPTQYGIDGFIYSDGRVGVEFYLDGHFSIVSNNNICDNKWHDILVTWDGTTNKNTVKLYVDDMKTPNNTITATGLETKQSTYNLNIGSLALGKWVKFVGDLDEFNVYNSVYSPSVLKVVLETNEKLQLSVDDDLSENTELTWTSSDNTVATVDTNGEVTALSPGNTAIMVSSDDGSYTDLINVLVVADADDYRLAVDLKEGKSCRLTIDDYTNTVPVTWTSMDPTVATISTKGKARAVSKGLTIMTATDNAGKVIGQIYVRVRV